MTNKISSRGVLGLMFNAEDPLKPHNNMLPFYAAEIGDKRVYCNYTMLHGNQLTEIGKLRMFAMQMLKTNGKFRKINVAKDTPPERISSYIEEILLTANDQDVLFFQWEKDDQNDIYFFNVINAQPSKSPLAIGDPELNITIGFPFSALDVIELREILNA